MSNLSDDFNKALPSDDEIPLATTRAGIEAQLLIGIDQIERGEVSEFTAEDWEALRERAMRPPPQNSPNQSA